MSTLARLLVLFVASPVFAVCPNGTVFASQFNKCYQYVSQATSFLLAEKNCERMSGTLVSISSVFENSVVSFVASQYASPNQTFWIGINSIYYTNWTWINKDPSTYRNWAADQPNSSLQCGGIQIADNQWLTAICNYAMPYMCQISPNDTRPCPNGHCPDFGYVLNPDTCKCYKPILGYKTNYQTVDICSYQDATLPIILNANDNNFLRYLMLQYSCRHMWLGLYCPGNLTTSCIWQDGTPQGFSNFPLGYTNGNAVAFMETSSGLWWPGSADGSDVNGVCQKNGIP